MVGAGSITALAGCASGGNETGGPHVEYEKSVNTDDGKTYVDLSLTTYFSCSWASPDDYNPVTINIEVHAAGEQVVSDTWQVEYEECMDEQVENRSYVVDGEYDSVLVQAYTDTRE